jgi:hypothetical protein
MLGGEVNPQVFTMSLSLKFMGQSRLIRSEDQIGYFEMTGFWIRLFAVCGEEDLSRHLVH